MNYLPNPYDPIPGPSPPIGGKGDQPHKRLQ